jgi:hypothetical protein
LFADAARSTGAEPGSVDRRPAATQVRRVMAIGSTSPPL